MSVLLLNALCVNANTFSITPCHIYAEEGVEGKKTMVGLANINISDSDTVIDCHNNIVLPSFACGHHHAYSALATGMHPPVKNPVNFEETLKYIWWTLDTCLDAEMIEASALATAIACARNGVTFVIDHHSSPSHIHGSLDIIAKAFDTVGISHLLCYEITDRNGPKATTEALEETDSYLSKRQGLVGLHASFTVSEDTMQQAAQLVEKHNSGIHIHVAEDPIDQNDCQQKYGKRVVERLSDLGLLNSSKSILSHCLHINDSERKLIHDSNVWIAQNTESNLNNKVGFFNSNGIEKNIMLGTDGMHSDMIKSAKSSFLVGQNFDRIDYKETCRRLRNVGRYIAHNQFAGNSENNLVVLNYNPPTKINSANFFSHFMYGIESKHIQHVVAGGKLIVKDQKVITVSEEDVMVYCRKLSKMLWDRMKNGRTT